jgi:hypothetical protein
LPQARLAFQYHVSVATREASPLYDRDFFEWTARNAQLLRDRLKALLVHLVKWTAQPGLRYAEGGASSWLDTIIEQRGQLESIFEQSPSLERHARESLDEAFRKAVKEAVYETRLPRSKFPTT